MQGDDVVIIVNEATNPEHPLNHLIHNPDPPRMMKKSIFNRPDDLITLHTAHHNTDYSAYETRDKKTIHTHVVQNHIRLIPYNSIINRPPLKSTNPRKNFLVRPGDSLLSSGRTNPPSCYPTLITLTLSPILPQPAPCVE